MSHIKTLCPHCRQTFLICGDAVKQEYYCCFCNEYYWKLTFIRRTFLFFTKKEEYMIEKKKAQKLIRDLKKQGVISNVRTKA